MSPSHVGDVGVGWNWGSEPIAYTSFRQQEGWGVSGAIEEFVVVFLKL